MKLFNIKETEKQYEITIGYKDLTKTIDLLIVDNGVEINSLKAKTIIDSTGKEAAGAVVGFMVPESKAMSLFRAFGEKGISDPQTKKEETKK